MTSGLQVTMLLVGVAFWRVCRAVNDIQHWRRERRKNLEAMSGHV